MMNQKISIVIATYNREKYLLAALRSVANQNVTYGSFELILVNNNSTDNTEKICLEFKKTHPKIDFTYVVEENQGLSYARNRGIKESSGDIVVFVDDDAELFDGYIGNLIKHFEKGELLTGGGRILPKWEAEKPIWLSKYLIPLVSVIDYSNRVVPFKKGKYPIGANMFFHKKVIERVGDFNVSLGRTGKNMMGGEEKDFFVRIAALGIPIIYLPDVTVWHNIPASRITKEFIRKQALGIGVSEYVRCSKSVFMYIKRVVVELYKWLGTLVLCLLYLMSFQYEKAQMLIKFRWWISKGLLGIKSDIN